MTLFTQLLSFAGFLPRRWFASVGCLLVSWLLWTGPAAAGPLADRLAAFPNWDSKPVVQSIDGDLVYPDWFQGTWEMTSTLVDLLAPLAPEITTPGFDSNWQYLNQPVICRVRFVPARFLPGNPRLSPLPLPLKSLTQAPIVADRAFNGLNLARAYLGDRAVLAVEVDPTNPNRQMTTLSGGRQLISIISGRATEMDENHRFSSGDSPRFITTELFQQVFRGSSQPYLNQVETTTAYQYLPAKNPTIVADQVTAIYLSPQDPQYFQAGNHPVALYRYRLEFSPQNH